MTDEQLLQKLNLTGNEQRRALVHLYQRKGQEFGRYFRRCGLTHADSEEAVQDTILKILRNCQTYSGEGTVNSWMWAIARNILIDKKRAQKRSLEENLDDKAHLSDARLLAISEATGFASSEIEICVSNGIKKFANDDPDRAYAISLHVDGVDGREIAERIGRTYEATRQYLLQCRQKVAPYISNCLEMIRV